MKILKFIWMVIWPNGALELWVVRRLKAYWVRKDAVKQ